MPYLVDSVVAELARSGVQVQRIVHAKNENNYCPGCQTGGVPLKDRRLSKLLK